MKTQLILLFMLLSFYNFSQKDNTYGNAIYTVSLNKNITSNSQNNKLSYLLQNSKDVEYLLSFNNKHSQYQKIKQMKNDIDHKINFTEIKAGGNNLYYFDNSNKINTYSKSVGADNFIITEKPMTWKLTKETQSIGKYTCFKAIGLDSNNDKINIIAWFTHEIPYPYGPKNYNNLPGLILRLETNKAIFQVQEITFTSTETSINKPSNGIKITAEEFKKRFSNFFKNK